MKNLLEPFVGREIGSNARKPYHLDSYTLDSVSDSYFTLSQEDSETKVHIPYRNIVRILENGKKGIHVGGLFHQKHEFKLIVKIGHVVTQIPA